MSDALKDQVAVIVGASSGIGRETALMFARAGATTVLAARGRDKLHTLAEEIGSGSSVAVQLPDASGVSYQAAKHGLVGLAHGTFKEEQDHGVRTTVIFPGLTDTPLVLKRPTPTPPEVIACALQPEDVAEACLFVASLPARARVPELMLMPSRL